MAKTLVAMLALAGLALAGCTSNDSDDAEPVKDFSQLHALFSDRPYKLTGGGDVVTPAHEWLIQADGTGNFLHWNNDDPMQATALVFFGDLLGPLKGCIGAGGISQAQFNSGFVHFHKGTAASWDAGHHGDNANPNLMGYWLRHNSPTTGDPDSSVLNSKTAGKAPNCTVL